MQEIERTFANFMKNNEVPGETAIAVACSGGPDSMALALIAGRWAAAAGVKILAITVDHGLRPESAKEAKQVGAWLKKRGIAHTTLTWKGKKPAANIQEQARKARYRLMSDYCRSQGIARLLVAHTQDDQAETFLLRLARGSGVDGLAAMAARVKLFDLELLRPLLTLPKAKLIAYLKAAKQEFIRDPANESDAFDRARLRKKMPELAGLGLTPERLCATAANMARARAHLEEETGRYLARACTIFPEGYALLTPLPASQEIALRALSNLVMMIGGQEVRTRLLDLTRLHEALLSPGFRGATLGGCLFARAKAPQASGRTAAGNGPPPIMLCREPSAVAGALPLRPGESKRWDNRFEITLAGDAPGLRVGALTQAGWLFCVQKHGIETRLPDKKILYSLPALRDRDGWLYAVPHLGLSVEGLDCRARFVVLG